MNDTALAHTERISFDSSLTTIVTNNTNEECTSEIISWYPLNTLSASWRQALAVLWYSVVCSSIYSNGLLVAGLYKRSRYVGRPTRDFILFNMAVADMMFSVAGTAILATALIHEKWLLSGRGCDVYWFSTALCVSVNNYSVAGLVIDRLVVNTNKKRRACVKLEVNSVIISSRRATDSAPIFLRRV